MVCITGLIFNDGTFHELFFLEFEMIGTAESDLYSLVLLVTVKKSIPVIW